MEKETCPYCKGSCVDSKGSCATCDGKGTVSKTRADLWRAINKDILTSLQTPVGQKKVFKDEDYQ